MRKWITFWHVGLVGVLLFGAVLLLTGWDRGLPLYESVDEVVNLDEIYTLRGLSDTALTKPGYPPGILYINYGAQILTELSTGDSAWDQPCLVIRDVRLIGIVANLLTALLVALSARKLSGDTGGLLAALAWLAAPEVLLQSQYGFPQVYEGLMYMLVLYTALLALEKHDPRYALFCTLAGLGAVIFKYATFPVLAIGVGVSLWEMRAGGLRWWRWLAAQLGLIALTAGLLLVLGGVGSLADSGHIETAQFLAGEWQQMFDPTLIVHIHTNAFGQVGWPLMVFLALLVAGTIAVWFQATVWQRLGWLSALFLVFSHTVFLGAYLSKLDVGRNLLTTSSVIAVISAVLIVALGRALGRVVRQPAVGYVGMALISLGWLGPQVVAAWDVVQYRALPVTYGAMVTWADQRIPEETLLVNDGRPYTRQWSCYRGNWRETVEADITDQPIEAWLAQDVYYAQLAQDQVEALQNSAEGRTYLDQMALIKQFPPPGEAGQWRTWRRGEDPTVALYRLWQVAPDTPTDITFAGQIRLLGYSLDQVLVSPGDELGVQFYWASLRPPDADYNVFVHLAPPDNATTVITQTDGFLARSALRPTSTWDDPDEIFISREFSLTIPDDLRPGEYQLRVGLYDWRTSERLAVGDGNGFFSIPLHVVEN